MQHLFDLYKVNTFAVRFTDQQIYAVDETVVMIPHIFILPILCITGFIQHSEVLMIDSPAVYGILKVWINMPSADVRPRCIFEMNMAFMQHFDNCSFAC